MSDAQAITIIRRQRRDAGVCPCCGGEPVAGHQMCAVHRNAHRERNRAYEQRLRDAGTKTPVHVVREQQRRLRQDRIDALIAHAERHGMLPTMEDCVAIIGHHGPVGGLVSRLRRDAFGLRMVRGVRRIPYPVPSEYLADHDD